MRRIRLKIVNHGIIYLGRTSFIKDNNLRLMEDILMKNAKAREKVKVGEVEGKNDDADEVEVVK